MRLTLADGTATWRGAALCIAIISRMDEAPACSDEELMQAFAGGDARAFETLYDRHALAVWRFVLRSVQDRAMTDDLVQDVWFSLVRQAPQYEPRARFRTWLFTLAHHRMVDHWRTRKHHASLDVESGDGTALAGSAFGPVRQVE